jgi:hypothetical protein
VTKIWSEPGNPAEILARTGFVKKKKKKMVRIRPKPEPNKGREQVGTFASILQLLNKSFQQ